MGATKAKKGQFECRGRNGDFTPKRVVVQVIRTQGKVLLGLAPKKTKTSKNPPLSIIGTKEELLLLLDFMKKSIEENVHF